MELIQLRLQPPEKTEARRNPEPLQIAGNWHFMDGGGHSEAGVDVNPQPALGLAVFRRVLT
jgi:hypothetical protein